MGRPLVHRLAGDESLAARAGAGDDIAFAALVRRLQPRLHAYCARILGDVQDADDAVQNTFISALAALRRDGEVRAVRPWLYRIAHNEAISLMRGRRPAGELVATVADRSYGPAETVALREEAHAVLRAIVDLPERSRDALLLREVAGLRHADVAQALGTSPSTARQAVFEARLALQDEREGRNSSCETIREELARRERRRPSRTARGHLSSCSACRSWSDAQAHRRRVLGLGPIAGAGGLWSWLGGLLGGGAATGGVVTAKAVVSAAAVAVAIPLGAATLEHHAADPAPRAAVVTAAAAPPSTAKARVVPVVQAATAATPATSTPPTPPATPATPARPATRSRHRGSPTAAKRTASSRRRTAKRRKGATRSARAEHAGRPVRTPVRATAPPRARPAPAAARTTAAGRGTVRRAPRATTPKAGARSAGRAAPAPAAAKAPAGAGRAAAPGPPPQARAPR